MNIKKLSISLLICTILTVTVQAQNKQTWTATEHEVTQLQVKAYLQEQQINLMILLMHKQDTLVDLLNNKLTSLAEGISWMATGCLALNQKVDSLEKELHSRPSIEWFQPQSSDGGAFLTFDSLGYNSKPTFSSIWIPINAYDTVGTSQKKHRKPVKKKKPLYIIGTQDSALKPAI